MLSIEIKIILIIIFSSILILTLTHIVFFLLTQSKKKYINNLKELEFIKNHHQNEILKTQIEIQENTFEKISREIHDNISLGLTLAKLHLTNYLTLEKNDPKLLEFTFDLISKSLADLNDISKSLDANQLVSHGLIKALESEINVLNKYSLFEFEMKIKGEHVYLDSEIDLVLLRIFQESCNNIIKHAKASKISIYLVYESNVLIMSINDNGIGFDYRNVLQNKEIRVKSGLKNIMARAKIINAEASIHSIPNSGTTIKIITPFKLEKNGTNN